LLKRRPDLSISEQDFWDDYARRKSLEDGRLEGEELATQKKKVEEYQQEIKSL